MASGGVVIEASGRRSPDPGRGREPPHEAAECVRVAEGARLGDEPARSRRAGGRRVQPHDGDARHERAIDGQRRPAHRGDERRGRVSAHGEYGADRSGRDNRPRDGGQPGSRRPPRGGPGRGRRRRARDRRARPCRPADSASIARASVARRSRIGVRASIGAIRPSAPAATSARACACAAGWALPDTTRTPPATARGARRLPARSEARRDGAGEPARAGDGAEPRVAGQPRRDAAQVGVRPRVDDVERVRRGEPRQVAGGRRGEGIAAPPPTAAAGGRRPRPRRRAWCGPAPETPAPAAGTRPRSRRGTRPAPRRRCRAGSNRSSCRNVRRRGLRPRRRGAPRRPRPRRGARPRAAPRDATRCRPPPRRSRPRPAATTASRGRADGPGHGTTQVRQPWAANGAAVSSAPVKSSAITQKRSRWA